MVFEESGLRFEFDDLKWQAIKFDESAEYKKLSDHVSESKAIDFLAKSINSGKLLLVEVKNFRGHRLDTNTQLRHSNNSEDLTTEVAQKIRDSVAATIGAARNGTDEQTFWKKAATHLTDSQAEIFVIAWFEEDRLVGYQAQIAKTKRTNALDKLKKKLRWLTTKVHIADARNLTNIDGFSASFLPQYPNP